MTSKEMLKTKISDDEYFHNKAPLGRKPNWVVLKKHGGYMMTQKEYDEALKERRR